MWGVWGFLQIGRRSHLLPMVEKKYFGLSSDLGCVVETPRILVKTYSTITNLGVYGFNENQNTLT